MADDQHMAMDLDWVTFKDPFQATPFYDSIIWTSHWGNILFLLGNDLHTGNLSSDKYGFTLLLLQFWLHARCQIHPVGPSIFSTHWNISMWNQMNMIMWSALKLLPPENQPKSVSSLLEGIGVLLIPSAQKSGLQVDPQLILEFMLQWSPVILPSFCTWLKV